MTRFRRPLIVLPIALVAIIATVIVARSFAAQATTAPSRNVGTLRQERIATLQQICDLADRMYAKGFGTLEDLARYQHVLLEARLEAAASPRDRIELLQTALDLAKKQEDYVAHLSRAGMADVIAPLQAKAYRQSIEIQMAEEWAK